MVCLVEAYSYRRHANSSAPLISQRGLSKRAGSVRRYLSWEAVVVILCGVVLSLVFAFFIHQAIHTRPQPIIHALDDTHNIDNELGEWPSNEYERMHAKKAHVEDSFDLQEKVTLKPRKLKHHKDPKEQRTQRAHKQQHGYMVTFSKNRSRSFTTEHSSSSTTEEPLEPVVKPLAPKRVHNNLVCVLSENFTKPNQVPQEHCTHLVFKDITYDTRTRRFIPATNSTAFTSFMKFREKLATVKFIVGLDPRFFRTLCDTVDKNARSVRELADEMAKWVSHSELSGFALTGQLIMSSRHGAIVKTLKHIHDALQAIDEPKPVLLYGGYMTTLQYPEKMILGRLRDIGRVVDMLVIESHYHEEEQYCRLTFPAVYVRAGDYPSSIPVKTSLIWMEMLKEDHATPNTSSLCFSLSLATLSFDVTLDDHTAPGTWCQDRKWLNYGEVCTSKEWVVPEEDTTVLSTFRRKKHNWVSYDSEYAVREKVSRAMDVFHAICTAVYHVDHDDTEGSCGPESHFPRLAAIRDVQKTHVDQEYYGIEKKAVPYSHDRERSKQEPQETTLICVVSELPTDLDHYPTEYCTHIIYREVVFFSEHKWFLPKDHEHGFHAFQQLGSRTHAHLLIGVDSQQLMDFYINIWRDPSKLGNFARSTVSWLNTHGFDGIALLDQHVASATVVKKYFPVIRRLKQEFDKTERKLFVVLGVSLKDYTTTPEDIAEALEDVARVTDYLIIETHYLKPTAPCKVTLPSTYLEHEVMSSTVPVRTAVSWMKILHLENQTSAALCFSLSMAVINFRVKPGADNASCKIEKWANFRETCSKTEEFDQSMRLNESITLVRKNKNTIQAFETEDTIQEKVGRVLTLYPHACVAAFHVEYDDSTGVCYNKFSRLAAIDAALRRGPIKNLRDITQKPKAPGSEFRGRAGGKDVTVTTSGPETRPHNLVCVMSENTTEKAQFPDKLCDFIVYMDLTYDGQLDKLVPKNNGSGLQLFSAIAERQVGNHLVAVSQDDIHGCLEKWKDALALSHFVITTTAWVRKNKFDGLAFLSLNMVSTQMSTILKMLRKFHEAFKESRPRSLLLMFGAQIKAYRTDAREFVKNLEQVSRIVDYTIVETHHTPTPSTCNTLLPNAFREYNKVADNVPIVTAVDWIRQIQQSSSPTPSLCFSVSLASLLYSISSTTNGIGEACKDEALSRFNETCRRNGWTGPMKDESAIGSYQYKADKWESFQSEEDINKLLRLAVKINPTACVAAYLVDYEDHAGICERGKPFPRLTAMRFVLDQLRNQ